LKERALLPQNLLLFLFIVAFEVPLFPPPPFQPGENRQSLLGNSDCPLTLLPEDRAAEFSSFRVRSFSDRLFQDPSACLDDLSSAFQSTFLVSPTKFLHSPDFCQLRGPHLIAQALLHEGPFLLQACFPLLTSSFSPFRQEFRENSFLFLCDFFRVYPPPPTSWRPLTGDEVCQK